MAASRDGSNSGRRGRQLPMDAQQYLLKQEGVAEAKVRLCYNAVDMERYQRRAVDNPFSGRWVVGTVCALRPEKGLDTLLRAFAALSDLGPELIIVGSGPEEARLRALSWELDIEADCNFISATSDVVEWLSRIDIFVLPSRSEAFPCGFLRMRLQLPGDRMCLNQPVPQLSGCPGTRLPCPARCSLNPSE
jgi:glycosyltransferase involved in cell wall biosynthesis